MARWCHSRAGHHNGSHLLGVRVSSTAARPFACRCAGSTTARVTVALSELLSVSSSCTFPAEYLTASSNAQSTSTHANYHSTAPTKKRKSHLEPSAPLRAQMEHDSTPKRRRPKPSRKRANFSPQRNLRLPGNTQCFVQLLTFKSHP